MKTKLLVILFAMAISARAPSQDEIGATTWHFEMTPMICDILNRGRQIVDESAFEGKLP